MKRSHWLCMVALSLMTTPALAMTGNVHGFLGQKSLDSGDWGSLDQQTEIGVLFDVRENNWPISIAADLLGSADEVDTPRGKIRGSTLELDLGVRKVFDLSGISLHPYVGGGLALVAADREIDTGTRIASDNDTGAGAWVSGGAYWTFSNHINVGMDIRFTNADVTVFNTTVEAGGTHVGAMVGYQW